MRVIIVKSFKNRAALQAIVILFLTLIQLTENKVIT